MANRTRIVVGIIIIFLTFVGLNYILNEQMLETEQIIGLMVGSGVVIFIGLCIMIEQLIVKVIMIFIKSVTFGFGLSLVGVGILSFVSTLFNRNIIYDYFRIEYFQVGLLEFAISTIFGTLMIIAGIHIALKDYIKYRPKPNQKNKQVRAPQNEYINNQQNQTNNNRYNHNQQNYNNRYDRNYNNNSNQSNNSENKYGGQEFKDYFDR